MPATFKPLKIKGLVLVEPQVFGDERGSFSEIYKADEFAAAGITKPFVQFNHSRSAKNVLRGLHFQTNPAAQGKLLRVLSGSIFDVAVDIRKGSPTFGRWEGVELHAEEGKMIYIPEGFAHGFCVLSDTANVEYFCTHLYSPAHENGLLYNDKELAIRWPVKNPVLSAKDLKYKPLNEADINFIYEN